MFGATQQAKPNLGGSLFGGLGQSTQAQPQQTGGLFSGLGQNTQSQPQTGGLFSGLGQSTQNQPQQQQQQQTSGLFGGLGQSTQGQAQAGGLFGNQNNQNNQQNQQNQPAQASSLFGGLGLGQQNQQQAPNQSVQQQGGGMFNSSIGQPQHNLQSSLWASTAHMKPREKSVPEQIMGIKEKWDSNSPNCAFQHYFYNKIDESHAPFYRPAQHEDPKAWEEALSKKPGPGYIPVLCVGHEQLAMRISLQQVTVARYNSRLHQINDSLTALLQTHDTTISVRAMNARRKHTVMKQRCLALATKVQILQNRGYQLGGIEEDLKIKLEALDKEASDPGMDSRGDEIWARLIIVRERAQMMRAEIEKSGSGNDAVLDEETDKRAKKILEDYQTQLLHLKKELDSIQKDYVDWEKQQPEATNTP